MKVESLVIVYKYDAVNIKSNFAHTAHHARRVQTKQKDYMAALTIV